MSDLVKEGRLKLSALDEEDAPWRLGGCSGRMITTEDGYAGDGFLADVDIIVHADFIVWSRNNMAALLDQIENYSTAASASFKVIIKLQARNELLEKAAKAFEFYMTTNFIATDYPVRNEGVAEEKAFTALQALKDSK